MLKLSPLRENCSEFVSSSQCWSPPLSAQLSILVITISIDLKFTDFKGKETWIKVRSTLGPLSLLDCSECNLWMKSFFSNILFSKCHMPYGHMTICRCGNMRVMQIMRIFTNMRKRMKISSTLTTYKNLPKMVKNFYILGQKWVGKKLIFQNYLMFRLIHIGTSLNK